MGMRCGVLEYGGHTGAWPPVSSEPQAPALRPGGSLNPGHHGMTACARRTPTRNGPPLPQRLHVPVSRGRHAASQNRIHHLVDFLVPDHRASPACPELRIRVPITPSVLPVVFTQLSPAHHARFSLPSRTGLASSPPAATLRMGLDAPPGDPLPLGLSLS